MKTGLLWLDRVMRLDEVLGSVALFGLFLVAFANVVMRYFFSAPLAWSEEVLQFLLMWGTFFGASALVRRNEHVLISFLTDSLPPRWAVWNERLFNAGVVLVCAVIMLIWGIKLLPFSAFRSTPMLHIPYYWVHLAIPVSAVMMIYHSLRRLVAR